MIESILLFYRNNCKYSEKFKDHLKTKTNRLFTVKNELATKPKNLNKILKKNYTYIISFKSYYILPQKVIDKASISAINFHSGTPKYRGVGCTNYALYDNAKTYGVTTHIIDRNIDNGKIIDVKFFDISKNDDVDSLIKKTNQVMLKRSIYIINNLSKNKNFLSKKIEDNNKIKWSKKIKGRKELDKFYEIKVSDKKSEIKKKIRATNTSKYKPYIKIKGYLFKYN